VREMRELGDFDPKQLVEFSIHDVDADFVREMYEAGFTDLDPKRLIEFKIHGVNADFMREMRNVED
jgi:hypothetical protein